MNYSLLPDYLKKPMILLWTNILPQTILCVINVWSFWLISEEVSQDRLHIAYTIFGAEIFVLLLSLIALSFSIIQKKHIHIFWNVILFFSQVAYLWYVFSQMGRVIPSTIEPWILDQGGLILNQLTFIMPGLFYAVLRLACFETKLRPNVDLAWSFVMAVLAPLAYYTVLIGMHSFIRPVGRLFPRFLAITFFILVTAITFIGLIRVIILLYNTIRSKGNTAQAIFAFVIALCGPIAGLIVNNKIPFPANFQSVWVYVLAIVNGLIVIVPTGLVEKGHKRILFLRSILYPFTFYFFLVFLPFFPLSLPAMFAIGSGFLFLVPVVLFLLHTKRLYDDFTLCREKDSLAMVMSLIVLGLSVLPTYFVYDAFKDKGELKAALKYVYSPDYSQELVFSGSVGRVQRTLVRLKEFKRGIQLPYISGFYNSVVFEGMVLPDSKIDYMYQLFSGEEIRVDQKQRWGFWGTRGLWRTGGRAPARDQNVNLVSFYVTTKELGSTVKSRIHLEMHNVGESNTAEFTRDMHIPQGVLITDFDLKVGTEMVQGKIFEKRAAMWVYRMIRDFTRIDPGILSYKSPTRVSLNVYPFTKNQTRFLEMELEFPRGFTPKISIGDQEIELTQEPSFVQKTVITSSMGPFAVISKEQLLNLSSFQRQPYIHFVLDFSKASLMEEAEYINRMSDILSQFKDVKQLKVIGANFEIEELSKGLIDVEDKRGLIDIVKNRQIQHRGSLDISRVLKQQLKQYFDGAMYVSKENQWKSKPLFVVISNNMKLDATLKDMHFFRPYLLDQDHFMISNARGKLTQHLLWDKAYNNDAVIALKKGASISILPANGGEMQLAYFVNEFKGVEVLAYNVLSEKFEPLNRAIPLSQSLPYMQGISLLLDNLAALNNPAIFEDKLSGLVLQSKKTGVMIPSTSYIIVERSSQWKMLDIKEKQRLRSSEGLEFEDDFNTPAPGLWILLLLFFTLENVRKRYYVKNVNIRRRE